MGWPIESQAKQTHRWVDVVSFLVDKRILSRIVSRLWSPIQPVQDASTYSLRYKTAPVSSFSAFQIANRLFKIQPRVYLEICPFMHHSYGPS